MKGAYKYKKAPVHWSAIKDEERPWSRRYTNRQPLVAFLDSVYIGFNTFVLPKGRQGRMFSTFWKGRALVAALRLASVPPRLPPRPAPLVGCVGFGFGRFIFSGWVMTSANE